MLCASVGVPSSVKNQVRLPVARMRVGINLKVMLSAVVVMPAMARFMSVPDHDIGVKFPDLNAVPGVVTDPEEGCKYTRIWLPGVCRGSV